MTAESTASIGEQALWISLHTLFAFVAWVLMMGAISLTHPSYVPVGITWSFSFLIPFAAGLTINHFRQDEVAANTWLIGLIWFLIVCLWVLDMPTGPNHCYHCDASQKVLLSFFSTTHDSNLLDGQSRFLGTWPATALVAYGMAAGFALRRRS